MTAIIKNNRIAFDAPFVDDLARLNRQELVQQSGGKYPGLRIADSLFSRIFSHGQKSFNIKIDNTLENDQKTVCIKVKVKSLANLYGVEHKHLKDFKKLIESVRHVSFGYKRNEKPAPDLEAFIDTLNNYIKDHPFDPVIKKIINDKTIGLLQKSDNQNKTTSKGLLEEASEVIESIVESSKVEPELIIDLAEELSDSVSEMLLKNLDYSTPNLEGRLSVSESEESTSEISTINNLFEKSISSQQPLESDESSSSSEEPLLEPKIKVQFESKDIKPISECGIEQNKTSKKIDELNGGIASWIQNNAESILIKSACVLAPLSSLALYKFTSYTTASIISNLSLAVISYKEGNKIDCLAALTKFAISASLFHSKDVAMVLNGAVDIGVGFTKIGLHTYNENYKFIVFDLLQMMSGFRTFSKGTIAFNPETDAQMIDKIIEKTSFDMELELKHFYDIQMINPYPDLADTIGVRVEQNINSSDPIKITETAINYPQIASLLKQFGFLETPSDKISKEETNYIFQSVYDRINPLNEALYEKMLIPTINRSIKGFINMATAWFSAGEKAGELAGEGIEVSTRILELGNKTLRGMNDFVDDNPEAQKALGIVSLASYIIALPSVSILLAGKALETTYKWSGLGLLHSCCNSVSNSVSSCFRTKISMQEAIEEELNRQRYLEEGKEYGSQIIIEEVE